MTEPAPQRYLRRAVTVAAFIVLAGPLIGSGILSTVVFGRLFAMTAIDGVSWQDVSDAASVVMLFVVFGYLLAALPCAIAGAILGWRTYTTGSFGYWEALAVAAFATFAGSFALDLIIGQPDRSFLGIAMFMLPLALISALMARWFLAKIGVLPSIPATSLAQH